MLCLRLVYVTKTLRGKWHYNRVTASMTETKVCTYGNKLYWQYPRNSPIQSRDRHVLLAGGSADPALSLTQSYQGGTDPTRLITEDVAQTRYAYLLQNPPPNSHRSIQTWMFFIWQTHLFSAPQVPQGLMFDELRFGRLNFYTQSDVRLTYCGHVCICFPVSE